MTFENVVLTVSAVMTGLFAGIFFAWWCAVTPGIRRLGDRTYLRVVKSTNRSIQNLFFGATFVVPIFGLPLATFQSTGNTQRVVLLLSASILFIIGGIGVTLTRNIPLNERLDRIDLEAASDRELTEIRRWFEKPWNRWHSVRTAASVATLILVIIACLS